MDSLIDDYKHLRDVIAGQIEALENNQMDKLIGLTEKKKSILQRIVAAEEKLTPAQRETIHAKTRSYVEEIIKEDENLRCLLHAKGKELEQKISGLESTKGNLGKIAGVYGKKFTGYSFINREG